MKKKQPINAKGIYRKKVNILLVEIVNRNFGDAVIADNTSYLITSSIPFWLKGRYVLQRYKIDSHDLERIKAADMVIFAGGGIIKYKYERFYESISEIVQCAKEHGIPVYFNSVGIEGYDSNDERCMMLKRALNADCVKVITVRDDLKTLRRSYLEMEDERVPGKNTAYTAGVIDPAVYTPRVYGVKKMGKTNTIGIGIVRHRIFEANGLEQVTKEIQLELWSGIAKLLEAHGYKWKFFVNGLRSDQEFAEEVLAYMGREQEANERLVERPVTADELVRTISSFEGIIACRMHANIIAYALGIPSIGLVWNDKLLFWGQKIGYPDRFLTYERFQPQQAVHGIINAMEKGVKPLDRKLKKSVQKPLRKFIRQYGTAAWKRNRENALDKIVSWEERLVAAALGGLDTRYSGIDCRQGLEAAIENGFQIFEADIRLTTDGKLVCVNGWSKATYEKLGLIPPGSQTMEDGSFSDGERIYTSDGIEYDAFMRSGYYGNHFAVLDARELFSRMERIGGEEESADRPKEAAWKLILDIGKPKKEILTQMLTRLKHLCCRFQGCEGHLIIRLQGKYEVEAVKDAGLSSMEIMYYVPPAQKREEKKLSLDSIGKFCQKQGIQWVSMPKEALESDVMAMGRKYKLKTCVFSYNTFTEVIRALDMGVDWVATSYLSVRELESWYEK